MLDHLRRERSKLDAWLTKRGKAHTFSLPLLQLHEKTRTLIDRYARGPCLDAGSGRSPWKDSLRKRGVHVVSIDIEDRGAEVDLIGDLHDMHHVESGSMETVLCTQVLEHLSKPWQALLEISRVLNDGGVLILSAPHLSVIHEAPHDYFRYTRFGLEALCRDCGFEVLSLEESGGLLSFLSHAISMVFLCTLGGAPGLRQPAWLANLAFIHLLKPIDRLFGAASIYPCNYVLLARKRPNGVSLARPSSSS